MPAFDPLIVRTAIPEADAGSQIREQTETSEQGGRQSRPHIYELDPLRATTALAVVAVHTLAFTSYFNQSILGAYIQNALVISLHYTREMFMFVTAFALVYVYYGKPFSATRFWKRRALGVFLPYCVWSFIYLLLSQTQHAVGSFIETLLIDIISGWASFQLYYILLTLQFYILFPLFLPFVSTIKKRPWTTLAVSFGIETLLLHVDYGTLERGIGTGEPFWQFIAQYQNSIVFLYQFYFILGALAALYLPQIRSFLQRYGRWTLIGFLVALLALWVHFFIQILHYKESITYAVSVLQPIMPFYSLTAIVFFCWLAYRWARKVDQHGHPSGYRTWRTLSDTSFGIYLVHALFLNVFMLSLVPAMPREWPVAMRVFLTWLITVGCATLASLILMNMPILSRLVGRPCLLPEGLFRFKGLKKTIGKAGQRLKATLPGDSKGSTHSITMKEENHFNHKR